MRVHGGVRPPLTGGPFDPVALSHAAGVSAWLSWVVNLLVVEYWLHRTRNRRRVQTTAAPALAGS
ncbi:hypothetical protein [Pseudonocardia aurantiaca]|uniref:Uncharacterized protein n=1 Tax=Pseudonocardia aurantiaca TaxID=75290 RepID=A0ABW4FIX3_9PSEU